MQIVAKVKVGEHSLDAASNLDTLDSAAGGGNPIFSASIWPSMDPSIHEFIRGRDAGELRFQEFRERFGAHLITSADVGGLFVITIRCGARLCGQASADALSSLIARYWTSLVSADNADEERMAN